MLQKSFSEFKQNILTQNWLMVRLFVADVATVLCDSRHASGTFILGTIKALNVFLFETFAANAVILNILRSSNCYFQQPLCYLQSANFD